MKSSLMIQVFFSYKTSIQEKVRSFPIQSFQEKVFDDQSKNIILIKSILDVFLTKKYVWDSVFPSL